MASPIHFYIIPDCGLEIKIKQSEADLHRTDPSKPMEYTLEVNEDTRESMREEISSRFVKKLDNMHDPTKILKFVKETDQQTFTGILSPSSRVTLPKKIRELAGFTEKAKRFAYLYPARGIGKLIDWKEYSFETSDTSSRRNKNNEEIQKTKWTKKDKNLLPQDQQHGKGVYVGEYDGAYDGAYDSTTYSQKINGMAHACLFGAFVYFDDNMKVIQVNALTVQETDYSINFTGPWELADSAMERMTELGRMQTFQMKAFQEGGFVELGWVNPFEKFKSQHISKSKSSTSGALILKREDGSGIAYHVAGAGKIVFHEEDVDIVEDCILSVEELLKSKRLEAKDFVNAKDHLGKFEKLNKGIEETRIDNLYNEFLEESEKDSDLHIIGKLVKEFKELYQDEENDIQVFMWEKLKLTNTGTREKAKNQAMNLMRRKKQSNNFFDEDELAEIKDKFGWSLLHYVCRFGSKNLGLVEFVLKDCDPSELREKDIFGRTPLYLACDGGAPADVVKILVEKDHNSILLETNSLQMIPLHAALNRRMDLEAITILLEADEYKKSLRKKSKVGRLPIHMAIEENVDSNIVEVILGNSKTSEDQDPDILTPFKGKLPIHFALLNKECSEGTIELLLQTDTESESLRRPVDNEKDDLHGSFALHLSLQYSTPETTRLLLIKDKNSSNMNSIVNLEDKKGLLPLHIACKQNARVDIVRLLLELDTHKASLHDVDIGRRMKPIHYACNNPGAKKEIIQALLESEKSADTKIIKKLLEEKQEERRKRAGKQNSKPSNKGQAVKNLCRSNDTRERTPLICAIRGNAPDDVISLLTEPDNLYLKGFDDHLVNLLGQKVKENEDMQDHILEVLSLRPYFSLLFLELYAHVFAIAAFITVSNRMRILEDQKIIDPNALSSDDETVFSSRFLFAVLITCLAAFGVRELVQLKSQGWHYIKDIWNIPEYLSIGFLIISLTHVDYFIENLSKPGYSLDQIDWTLPGDPWTNLAITGMFLIVTFIFYLRSAFLPFANFVGGLISILSTLIPFFIVGALLLLAFTIAYRISLNGSSDEGARLLEEDDSIEVDCSGGFYFCFLWTLQSFFNGSDETNNFQDVIFGIVAIVILLNVVIAIVGDAWESATEKASTLYWSYRVGYILQTRISGVFKKKLERTFKGIGSLANLIDKMPNIKIQDDIVWSKGFYTRVASSEHYFCPELYFINDEITQVENARSLQADIHWAGRQAAEEFRKDKKGASETAIQLAALKNIGVHIFLFLLRFILYAILIALGIFTFGFFWPRNLRKGILTLGIEQTKTRPEPESKPMGVEELAIESKKASNDDTNADLLSRRNSIVSQHGLGSASIGSNHPIEPKNSFERLRQNLKWR
ncbi:hypothetical protein CTEN210_05031 [Chaetoceros tenuissimus]|uniref:Ion transport domain-containing protein n=1 Tax=Chaetoceros tenuissimus TaxID=426638 RepID=A0AAD3CPQ8_9STRA|nr:hypothetical protein CTEN210_05031 [Chaetoceros tenuissimus]